MSTAAPKRRVRVTGDRNSNIYKRYDGRFEVGYRDATGRQRWNGPHDTITRARAVRDDLLGRKANGERTNSNPRLKFGDAADRWLTDQVSELRPTTQARYANHVHDHLSPRWGNHRLDAIDVNDAAKLVRDMRADGYAESTINGVLQVANRVFKFARRRCGWHGENPIGLMESSERPQVSAAVDRRIYQGDELAQVIAATTEPWRTLFRLASVVGARVSELLGLVWADLDLRDVNVATVTFTHQLDRSGQRVALKTEESKAMLPLPRSTALMLLEHRARCGATGERALVFQTRTGGPVSQRNVLRALYIAQEQARDPDGKPTFPQLFEHDEHGQAKIDDKGRYVPAKVKRSEIALPDFHAIRHAAAMDCDDAEEARDLLRHRNSNVTRAVYRAHFADKQRERLRAKMEARHGAVEAAAQQVRS